jgi:hypothetical protein
MLHATRIEPLRFMAFIHPPAYHISQPSPNLNDLSSNDALEPSDTLEPLVPRRPLAPQVDPGSRLRSKRSTLAVCFRQAEARPTCGRGQSRENTDCIVRQWAGSRERIAGMSVWR